MTLYHIIYIACEKLRQYFLLAIAADEELLLCRKVSDIYTIIQCRGVLKDVKVTAAERKHNIY